MITLQIPRAHLRAVRLFAASEARRPWLNGVRIEVTPGWIHTIATDGARLAVCRYSWDEAATPCAFTVPSDAVSRLKVGKRMSATDVLVPVLFDPATKMVTVGDEAPALCVDGAFPDWRRVVPAKTSGEAAHFVPEHLIDFQKAAGILSRPDTVPLFWQNGDAPALVSIEGYDEFRGVVTARQWGVGNRRVPPVQPSCAGFTQ